MNEYVSPPPIGGNLPEDLASRLTLTRASILEEVERLAERANKGPTKVNSDADIEAAGLLVTDARALRKRLEDAHKEDKAPFLAGGTTVDVFFREPRGRMSKVEEVFNQRADDYRTRKANEERAKREAEARKLREEESKRLELARKAEADGRIAHAAQHGARAEEALAKAEEAEIRAAAPLADQVAPSVSAFGVKSSAKAVWTGEIVDYAALDLNVLRPYLKRESVQAALDLAVKQGVRTIAGARVAEVVKGSFR